MDGFAFAGEALSGKYYGARDLDGFRKMVRRLFGFGGVMVVAFTLVYALGGLGFLRLLTDDESVIMASRPYLPWVYLIPLTGVAAFIYDGVFIGLTETKGMLVTSVGAMTVFFLFYYLAWSSIGNNALWISFLLFLGLRGLFQYFWAKSFLLKRFINK